MSLFVAWAVFPALLALLALGCGLLLERAAGITLPRSLLVPAGMATIIVLAQVPIAVGAGGLATPLIVLAAVAGVLLSRPWHRMALRWWPIGAALAVFAVYAAPIVLSGEATFAGYIKLDDTSTWLAITDQVMEHGRDISGLAPSTYEATLDFNLAAGYPYGIFLPLGIGHVLLSTDVAWLIQPYMAVLALALMLVFWNLSGRMIERAWLRAAVSFVAAQPALLYGYYLWGGVKELAAAMLLALVVALLAPALEGRIRLREMLAPGCAIAAVVAVLSPAGLAWLVPALTIATIVAWRRVGARVIALAATLALAVAAVSAPVLITGKLLPATARPLTSAGLGNLFHRLSVAQIVGVWPVGDFRVSPDDTLVTVVLIALGLAAALWGLVSMVRGRAVAPAVYVTGIVIGSIALYVFGSPWNGAKALAAGSPAVLLAAGVGVASLARSGRRFEAFVLGGIIAAGVLWSNVLAYREVWLAPRPQLVELERIGKEIDGQGPTLMTEYQPYGVRHFLRDAEPEGASELRRRTVPLVTGGTLEKGKFADTDRLELDGLLVYRTLVLRRSPSQSRPPLPYALLTKGRYYEVWQRPEGEAGRFGLIEHVGLGSGLDPGGTPSCGKIAEIAERAPQGAKIVAALAPRFMVVALGEQARPEDWPAVEGDVRLVTPTSSGDLTAHPSVPRAGDYEFWVGGSISGGLELSVNGRAVADVRHQQNNYGQYISLDQGFLRRGENTLELRHEAGGWGPGVEVPQEPIGPLVLRPVRGAEPIVSLAPANAENLCGRRLDWVALTSG
jgi:hypothetical protein